MDVEKIRDFLQDNRYAMLALGSMALLLFLIIILTVGSILPQWAARRNLVREAETAVGGSGEAGQLNQQLDAAQDGFDAAANQLLTEPQAAAFLDGLYESAAAAGVSIVELAAQAVPQPALIDGEKPVYDTRQFGMVAEGDLLQLNSFVGRIEETAASSIIIKNLQINQGGNGVQDRLTLDLFLYTSPFSAGEPIVDAGVTAVPPVATQPPPPPETAVPTPVPDVSDLIDQLDDAWAVEDWTTVIALIQEIRQKAPATPDMAQKLYAARVNYGYRFIDAGNIGAAIDQFEQALAIEPNGAEAEAALLALFAPAATSTPTMLATETPSITVHIVQRGDTLYSIARHYGSTVDGVKSANGLVNNGISPGQQLIIP